MDERIVELLQGYARANEYLEQERIKRLAQLSQEESWEIFRALVDSAQEFDQGGGSLEAYYAWRL